MLSNAKCNTLLQYLTISIDMKRVMISLPEEQVDALDALVNLGMASSRAALIQQIVGAFILDIRQERPKQNPSFLQSALGALAAAFLVAIGVAALKEIFGGDGK